MNKTLEIIKNACSHFLHQSRKIKRRNKKIKSEQSSIYDFNYNNLSNF